MRGSFSRDIIEGLLKPRGLLLLALTAAAAGTAAWAASPPFKVAAAMAAILAAAPALIVWGAFVGISRRMESAVQGSRDLSWAIDGLHGRGEELGSSTRNLEVWCEQLADRATRLERLVSELQTADPVLSNRIEQVASRGEALRLIVVDLGLVVQQVHSKIDPLARSVGDANDALGKILSDAIAQGAAPQAADSPGQAQYPSTSGGVLNQLKELQAEQAEALQQLAGRLSLVEDGLLAHAVTIENVVRGANGADHAAG